MSATKKCYRHPNGSTDGPTDRQLSAESRVNDLQTVHCAIVNNCKSKFPPLLPRPRSYFEFVTPRYFARIISDSFYLVCPTICPYANWLVIPSFGQSAHCAFVFWPKWAPKQNFTIYKDVLRAFLVCRFICPFVHLSLHVCHMFSTVGLVSKMIHHLQTNCKNVVHLTLRLEDDFAGILTWSFQCFRKPASSIYEELVQHCKYWRKTGTRW